MRLSNFVLVFVFAGLGALSADADNALRGPVAKPIAWRVTSTLPVIKPGFQGQADARRAGASHVIQVGNEYRMYYWGADAQGSNVICLAVTSIEEPNAWQPKGIVLRRPEDREQSPYNVRGPSFPYVVPREGSSWLMYFCGWGNPRADKKLPNRTGVALSDDGGLTWRYVQNDPVIELDQPYDREATGSVWVDQRDGQLHMYYTAIGKYFPKPPGVASGHGTTLPLIGIGYATSSDGIQWNKPRTELLVKPRAFDTEPYEYICSKPCLIREDQGYRLWVNTFGSRYRVRSLVSGDGLNWTWTDSGPNGELGTGPSGSFDDQQRSYISVVRHGDEYRAWFTGNGFGATGIGYATATIPTE